MLLPPYAFVIGYVFILNYKSRNLSECVWVSHAYAVQQRGRVKKQTNKQLATNLGALLSPLSVTDWGAAASQRAHYVVAVSCSTADGVCALCRRKSKKYILLLLTFSLCDHLTYEYSQTPSRAVVFKCLSVFGDFIRWWWCRGYKIMISAAQKSINKYFEYSSK